MGVGEGEEVLSKLGKDWPSKVLAARKWQDKKVMLDKLLSVTSGRRLAAADYSEVPSRTHAPFPTCNAACGARQTWCRAAVLMHASCPLVSALMCVSVAQVVKTLRVLMADSMVLVVTAAIKAIGTRVPCVSVTHTIVCASSFAAVRRRGPQ